MSIQRLILVLALGLNVVACKRDEPGPSPAGGKPATVTTVPDDVVGLVALPSLERTVGGLRAYVDAVQPGASAMVGDATIDQMLAGAVGAAGLGGVDRAAPLYLALVDGTTRGAVLVATVRDPQAIAAGGATASVAAGWLVLGPADAVKVVEPWARGGLITQPAPAHPTATIYLPRLLARHQAELAMIEQQMRAGATLGNPAAGEFFDAYLGGLASLGADIDQLVVGVEVSGELLSLDFAAVARPGSRLAQFAAAQRPSDFAWLGRLPAGVAQSFLMAGRIDLGPYRDGLLGAMTEMLKLPGGAELARAMLAIAELATGEVAAAVHLGAGGFGMVELVPVSDVVAADRVVRALVGTLADGVAVDSMGMRLTMTGRSAAATHAGVAIHESVTTLDLATAPVAQRAVLEAMYHGGQRLGVAATDGALVVAMGGTDRVAGAIDALRGKAAGLVVAAPTQTALARARARGDSVVMAMDLNAFRDSIVGMVAPGRAPSGGPTAPTAPLLLGLGAAGGALHLRIDLPSPALRASIAPSR